ncbi:Hsp20/alpha crystallin family protein [Flavobacterium sp.]|uniref:Hsp20/alpha crystallin family protein n=1 Tax=Flavobacterium sp. TaxID=239 RepID=UPI003D6C066D
MSTVAKKGSSFPKLMENFFPEFIFDSPLFNGFLMDRYFKIPEANIIENPKDYQIELAVPGMQRKDFKIELENGVLSISAEKEEEKEEKGKNFRRKEFSFNSFSRSFSLPDNLLDDEVDAKYENGVLRLTLPKKEVSKSKPTKLIEVS